MNDRKKRPTELFRKFDGLFESYAGDRLKSELGPLQQAVTETKHPWNYYQAATLVGGGLGTFLLTSLWQPLLWPGVIATGFGFFKTNAIARAKNKILREAQGTLDDKVADLIDLDVSSAGELGAEALQLHSAAGFLGRYDEVKRLLAYAPRSRAAANPQVISTHLTRTEVEHYTDSNGRQQTRTRIVNVFEGLLMELEVPDAETDNRILITSRRTSRVSGPFERIKFSKRRRMDDIGFSSPAFKKIYRVESDDGTLAHLFLDPDRIVRFINLHEDLAQRLSRKKVKLSILITQGKALIALEMGGVAKVEKFSADPDKLKAEALSNLTYAAMPHVIAQHIKLAGPVPYAWQDAISKA